MNVVIDKEQLEPYIIYDKSIRYDEKITLYPIKMKNIVDFQLFQTAITVRKDAIFQDKKVIKMGYFEFIKYAALHPETIYNNELPLLPFFYSIIVQMLPIICGEQSSVKYNNQTLDVYINDELIIDQIFDDLRRIIIIQNDIDFNIDEFMNIDTVHALEKARAFEAKKNKEKFSIEDYIDSLAIELKVTNDYIENLTIRKFWRYIKRINKRDQYEACLNGQMSGMVTFKEPIEHWMTSLEITDKYENLKANEEELRGKIG